MVTIVSCDRTMLKFYDKTLDYDNYTDMLTYSEDEFTTIVSGFHCNRVFMVPIVFSTN